MNKYEIERSTMTSFRCKILFNHSAPFNFSLLPFLQGIFFIAETKGTMDSLNIRPIEKAKIECAKRLQNAISTSKVRYQDVDSYQSLLSIMDRIP